MENMPTDRELEALKVLWRFGEATVRDICERMAEAGTRPAYTTVLSLLQVMEQKGLVGHRQDGKAYVYFARAERDRTFRKLAGGVSRKGLRRGDGRIPRPHAARAAAQRGGVGSA